MKEVNIMTKEAKTEKSGNSGLIVLIICGVLAAALMIGCIFFPDQLFGFLK